MKNLPNILPATRREFLHLSVKGIGLLAFTHYAPAFLVSSARADVPSPRKDWPILVLIQLAGGNDGLNTVVPYADDRYYRLRPSLGIPKDKVLKLDDHLGLNPACAGLHQLAQAGKVAIIQNVGYPNPNRSHFRSTDIWETASDSNEYVFTGFVGRYFDNCCRGEPASADPLGVHLTNEVPEIFLADKEHPTFGVASYGGRRQRNENHGLLEKLLHQPGQEENESASYLRHTMMDALVTDRKVQGLLDEYRAGAEYPGNPFALELRNVAALIAGGLSTRVYFVSLGSFDTHVNQLGRQDALLRTLGDGLAAFQRDLEAHRLADQVIAMTFSEFGRRPLENDGKGTDHGTAAPLFVMGSRVKGGLHGAPPDLSVGRNQDLTYRVDFRQVYATVIDKWLAGDSVAVLGRKFEPLGFI
jgi:uncharacterized protein (DUF1501 family)